MMFGTMLAETLSRGEHFVANVARKLILVIASQSLMLFKHVFPHTSHENTGSLEGCVS